MPTEQVGSHRSTTKGQPHRNQPPHSHKAGHRPRQPHSWREVVKHSVGKHIGSRLTLRSGMGGGRRQMLDRERCENRKFSQILDFQILDFSHFFESNI